MGGGSSVRPCAARATASPAEPPARNLTPTVGNPPPANPERGKQPPRRSHPEGMLAASRAHHEIAGPERLIALLLVQLARQNQRRFLADMPVMREMQSRIEPHET